MQATLRAPAKEDTYTVTFNGDLMEMPLGKSVGEARKELADHLGIPPDAKPCVDGRSVDDSYVPPRGATLEFVQKAGELG